MAEIEVDAGTVIGEVHPYVYGHFVEHLVLGLVKLNPARAWLLTAPDPLPANTLETPEQVRVQGGPLPAMQGDGLRYELPASSVAVRALET